MYGSKLKLSAGVMEAARQVMSGVKVFEKNGIKVEVPASIAKESQQDFVVKAAAAKKAGKKEFEFAGKKFPVTIKIDPDKVTEALGDEEEKKKKDKVEVNPEVEMDEELDEGVQDKKAVEAMKAMLDGMSKKDAITKFGVSPKKLDQLRKSMFGEETDDELDEKTVDTANVASKKAMKQSDKDKLGKLAKMLAKEKK